MHKMAKIFTFNESWNITFMRMAQEMSARSKDTSTKVGAVVISPTGEVLSSGYNGFPRGVNDNEPMRQLRPTKYDFVVHAEVNALLNAGRSGTKVSGGILYVTMPPCTNCAGAVIQAGIREIIYLEPDVQKQIPGWRDKLTYSFQMFNEAGVAYKTMNKDGLMTTEEIWRLAELLQKTK
jgi:dCMP deaminase